MIETPEAENWEIRKRLIPHILETFGAEGLEIARAVLKVVSKLLRNRFYPTKQLKISEKKSEASGQFSTNTRSFSLSVAHLSKLWTREATRPLSKRVYGLSPAVWLYVSRRPYHR